MKNRSGLLNSLIFGLFLLAIFFLFSITIHASTDLDEDGILDDEDAEVVVLTDQSLTVGEYFFNNLTIASNTVLTLESDPESSEDFKGVKITAQNITVESGSSITANGTGHIVHENSPGAGDSNGGYGHGGRGGDWSYKTESAVGGGTYGSALYPKDLGSGGDWNAGGGGAIWFDVSGTLRNDGVISADGVKQMASGGSVYVETSVLEGAGIFTAHGARCKAWPYSGSGGGGRIAVHYDTSSFTGTAEASRGALFGDKNCLGNRSGEEGTSVFIDTTNNVLYLYNRMTFQQIDSPYSFNQIVLRDGAVVMSEEGVSVTASAVSLDEASTFDTAGIEEFNIDSLHIDDDSVFTSGDNQSLLVSELTVRNGGEAQLGRGETLGLFDEITLEDESKITGTPMEILHLEAQDIFIDNTSTISVAGAGHPPMTGPGYNDSRAGASHGGLGENGGVGTPSPVYGSEIEPVDFGSGGSEDAYGGGALRIVVTGTLENNGIISADAGTKGNGASGGSVYVTTYALSGSGVFTALGGNTRGYTAGIGAGGGGRVAVYFRESDFVGTTTAKGGNRYVGGPIQKSYYAQDGTVVFDVKDIEPEIDPLLLQYLPILRMHPEEDYFPMNVEAFVEASALWDDRGVLPDKLVRAFDAEDPVTVEFLDTFDDTEDFYLAFSDPENSKSMDLSQASSTYKRLVQEGKVKTTVYAHRMEDSYQDSQGETHTFTVLQYWYFYAMNNWAEHEGFNNHEGDWESVFVFLDENEEPKYVAFSAHHNDGENEKFNFTQYDSVRRGWDESEVEGDTVTSYVALGSHANYPKPGAYKAGLKFDFTSNAGREFSFDNFEIKKEFTESEPSWVNYEGKWGTDGTSILGNDVGPQGPNFINVSKHLRFHNPIEWAGIHKIIEVTLASPTTYIDFLDSGVEMLFSDDVPAGTQFSVSPYYEAITSGVFPESTQMLAPYWDIESSLDNGTFNTTVYFDVDPAIIEAMSNSSQLNVYWFNPDTDHWEKQESIFDVAESTVSFNTTHFSRYALGIEEVESSEEIVEEEANASSYGTRVRKVDALPVAGEEALTMATVAGNEAEVLTVLAQVLQYIVDIYEKRGSFTNEEVAIISEVFLKIMERLSI